MFVALASFSEGRRAQVVGAIVEAAEARGARALDVVNDPDANRSVVTLAAAGQELLDALVEAVRAARTAIDLNVHRGTHPRAGATDLVLVSPVEPADLAAAVALAHRLGEEIFRRLGIPVYFCEAAARRPERRDPAAPGRGQFEGLLSHVADPGREPDVGPARLHPTAGVTTVGARALRVTLRVRLATGERALGRAVARGVRQATTGLATVELAPNPGEDTLGLVLEVEDPTRLLDAFAATQREAKAHGVGVRGSEFVGLVPLFALASVAAQVLGLRSFTDGQVLERRIWCEKP